MESIQIKDFLQYKYLSNVKYAPDGKKAAFVVANCNEDENMKVVFGSTTAL